jgi:hypothetical protein
VSVPTGAPQSNNIYVDAFNEIDSDGSSADEASMDDRLEDNHNASSASYSASYTIISPANPQVVASACHVSASLASQAQAALSHPKAQISFTNAKHDECCANSGATEHMIPDYKAFTSYKRCTNKFVTLGDTTKLPIMGRGKAKFYLNNKVVEVRIALHVPGLQAPLYSLRRQRHMEGCGYYSQFGVGSFILFPT